MKKLNQIREAYNQAEDRENNIKHLTLNISNTKHRTLDTNIHDLPSGESYAHLGLRPADGLSPGGELPQVEVTSSGVVAPALVNSDFQYIAVSLKTQESQERISANVDFRLHSTQSNKFNKLVFDLVGWTRRREFFANIQDIAEWSGYQTAYQQQQTADYIGKGRSRTRQQKGTYKRTPIREETAMLLSATDHVICHLWIENAYFTIPLEPWQDTAKLFCAKGEFVSTINHSRIGRGGWL